MDCVKANELRRRLWDEYPEKFPSSIEQIPDHEWISRPVEPCDLRFTNNRGVKCWCGKWDSLDHYHRVLGDKNADH